MPKPLPRKSNDQHLLAEREKILWDELRSIRDISFGLLKWGVTVLASLQTAISFLRKEIRDTMIASKELQPHLPLPAGKYLVGTLILFVVAAICSYLTILTGNRYRYIRSQLVDSNHFGIGHGDQNKAARYILLVVFFTFPALDLLVRYLWLHWPFEIGR